MACAALVLTTATYVTLAARHGDAGALGSGTAASIRSQVAGPDSGADTSEAADVFGRGRHVGHLAAATSPPAPAPPSLADSPPLRPHEVFGFAPYWTLPSSSGFNVAGITTLAYFSLDVNANGTLNESGAGWNGYQSQALSNLVTRAHAASDRVVLSVTDFDQGSLDALTSSPAAATTLASALVAAVSAKNLDGVNLDLEGVGDADQAGLTRLVGTVSGALHRANTHYQVTMDTYASSASGTNGFYDIPALAPLVDGFFVMEYSPNLAASAQATSPLTSGLFSVQTTVDEYAAAVPPSKVILGLAYFGIDWPTTNGTLTATATGPATDVSLGEVLSSGHPLYWDPVTESGWTSYQVGQQWHETFFEDPPSLYNSAALAQAHNLAGVGIWALGMDGNNADDLAALDGFAPALAGLSSGPTSASSPATASPAPAGSSPTPPSHPNPPAPQTTTTTRPASTTTTTKPSSSTTTTTTVPQGGPYAYAGDWDQTPVTLSEVSGSAIPPTEGSTPVGQLQGFVTNDPAATCLEQAPTLAVWLVNGDPSEYLVVATSPTDCVDADFTFSSP
jgi:Glycosyl hydrolases family 18